MSEDRPPSRSQAFEIGDLVRLNEELKQIRDVLKRKRAEREQAKREGRRVKVDLTPEIERLGRFLTDVERASTKLKSTRLPLPGTKPGETNVLGDILGKVKTEMENEKKKLEAEREAREIERLKHEQELQKLRDEIQKNKDLLNTSQKSLATVMSRTIEQSEKLEPEPKETDEITKAPTEQLSFSTAEVIVERPPLTAEIEPNKIVEKEQSIETKPEEAQTRVQVRQEKFDIEPRVTSETLYDKLEERTRQDSEARRALESRVTGEFTAIRSELQRLREQDSLEAKRRDLELEKRMIEEDRRILQAKIADTFTSTRSELERLKEQISRKQEDVESKRKELEEDKIRVDEEKRSLRERLVDVENDRFRFMARKMMEELQDERSELTNLKNSLQQLRAESVRERKRLETDRDSILRARVTLEKQKRKMAWKKAILEIKARSALTTKLLRQQPKPEAKQPERVGIQKESAEKNASTSLPPVISTAADDGAVVLGVRLGEEDYGINISKVREIMKRSTITPVPRQPAYVEGVMNVRGTIIPVVNLRRRFDLKGEPTANQHTVIVDSSEGMVGILVDSVSQVIRLPPDHIHPAPPIASGVEGEYLRGICRVGDRLLLYLDVEKILRKATPVSMLQHRGQLGMQGRIGRLALSSDEQKVIKAIPITGIIKSGLKKRTKFSDARLTRTISSLKRRGLVKTTKDGNKRVISRTSSTAHAN